MLQSRTQPISPGRQRPSSHREWTRFLLDHLIQDVPEAIALCEFDCRRTQCMASEWETCERRLKQDALRKAAGRLAFPSER